MVVSGFFCPHLPIGFPDQRLKNNGFSIGIKSLTHRKARLRVNYIYLTAAPKGLSGDGAEL